MSNTILIAEDANRPEFWVKGRRITDRAPEFGGEGFQGLEFIAREILSDGGF